MDLGIRASFSLPLQQSILVTCSAVKGKWARMLELSKAWCLWVGGGGHWAERPEGMEVCLALAHILYSKNMMLGKKL